MLVLGRKAGEGIRIGNTKVTIVKINNKTVVLRVTKSNDIYSNYTRPKKSGFFRRLFGL